MILIDEVLGWNELEMVSALTIRRGSPFFEEKGIAAHVAIEWMAQTCGAFVGAHALQDGLPVRIGFLLGTRDFSASVPWFALGDRLVISVSCTFNDGSMAVFDCTVARESEICVTAGLTVFQPVDLAGMLAQQGIAARGRGLGISGPEESGRGDE